MKHPKFRIGLLGAVLLLALVMTGCSSMLGPSRPIYSYPTTTTTPEAPQEIPAPSPPPAPVVQPDPVPEPPKPVTPPSEYIYKADSRGVVNIPFSDWPFKVELRDPLLIIFEVDKSGTYEITHTDFARSPLYMSVYSFTDDDPIAQNLVDGKPVQSCTALLQEGESYILGVGLLTPQDLYKTTGFSIRLLETAKAPDSEYIWVETPHPHTYDVPVPDVKPIEYDFGFETVEPVTHLTYQDAQATTEKAIVMQPFTNPSIDSRSELKGNVEGVLTKADSPYYVSGDITIPAGKTLTIEPGVILRFASNRSLTVKGVLDARGRAGEEVVFTSESSTTAGQWNGIIFDNGSKATLEHARVLYAGQQKVVSGAWRNASLFALGDAKPTITRSQIAHGVGDALILAGTSAPEITESDIRDMQGYPVRILSVGAQPGKLADNRYENITNHGIILDFNQVVNNSDITLKAYGDALPYFTDGLHIREGSTVRMDAGAVLKVGKNKAILVDGTLISNGVAGKPVFITSIFDDIAGDTNGDGTETKGEAGQWQTIVAQNKGKVELNRTRVSYAGARLVIAGGWRNTALASVGDASVTLKESEVTGMEGDAFFLSARSTLSVTDSLISDGTWIVRANSYDSLPQTLSGNRYENITNHGIILDFNQVVNNSDITLKAYGDALPYFTDGLHIREGSTVRMDAGAVLKVGKNKAILVDGTLISNGVAGKPVFITSIFDDIAGDTNGDGTETKGEAGQWQTIVAQNKGKVELNRTRVSYAGARLVIAGGWRNTALAATRDASVALRDSEVVASEGNAIHAFQNARVVLNNVAFEQISKMGIQLADSATADARQTWWGAASGPTHASNPNGSGLEISDGVNYVPHLTRKPSL